VSPASTVGLAQGHMRPTVIGKFPPSRRSTVGSEVTHNSLTLSAYRQVVLITGVVLGNANL
jgi:hypothetical protein